MDWAADLLRIKTKLLGLDVDDLANALGLSPMDAEAIWALWIGDDPYEYAGLLAER